MSFIDCTKSILENLFYLSGTFAFLVALYRLWNNKFSYKLQQKRDSTLLALELSDKYQDKTQAIHDKLSSKLINDSVQLRDIVHTSKGTWFTLFGMKFLRVKGKDELGKRKCNETERKVY